jgi:hypothetical protein
VPVYRDYSYAIGQLVNPRRRAILHARGVAIARPASSLPDFDQLHAKILHGLQGTVKLSLVPKDTYQDGAVACRFDVQVQSLKCSNECISQLAAYADLIGEALSASRHDREVAAWPMVAATRITMTSLMINELITAMPPPDVDSRRNDRITAHCS